MTQPVDSSILHEIVRVIESRRKVPEKVVVKSREYLLTYLEDHQRRLEEALHALRCRPTEHALRAACQQDQVPIAAPAARPVPPRRSGWRRRSGPPPGAGAKKSARPAKAKPAAKAKAGVASRPKRSGQKRKRSAASRARAKRKPDGPQAAALRPPSIRRSSLLRRRTASGLLGSAGSAPRCAARPRSLNSFTDCLSAVRSASLAQRSRQPEPELDLLPAARFGASRRRACGSGSGLRSTARRRRRECQVSSVGRL